MTRACPTPRLTSTVVLSVLLLGAVVLAGCGRGRGAGSPSTSASSAAPTTSGATTLSGTIIEGTKPGCRILQTDRRRYALTGPHTGELRVGQRVEVTGDARPGLLGPCGATFVVTSVGTG